MAQRILICRSNPLDPDPRVDKIARALCESGYTVTLLGWDRTGQLPPRDTLTHHGAAIQLHRLQISAPFGHGLANLPNLIRWQWGEMRWLAGHRRQVDLIHACDFDTVLPALIARLLWGVKVVYDIFDFYADHLRATPQLLKRLIRAVDLRAIDWADGLILADDARWEQIAGARPKRSAVIYNSPSDDGLSAAVLQADRASAQLHLAYIGLLQVERGLLDVIHLLGRHPDWQLDLAGFGGDEELIKTEAATLENIHWHGRVPYTRALQLSAAADVLFALYDPSIPNHRYSSPNKVFEAMLLGKPIVVARATNMDKIVSQADCGLVVGYGDQAAIENALKMLQDSPGLRRQLGENARRAYQERYSWSKMKSRLLELYRAVLHNQNHP